MADCAVATTGWAFVENKNIAGLVDEFSTSLTGEVKPEELAQQLAQYFAPKVAQQGNQGSGDVLTFLVGGYTHGVGRTYEVGLPSGQVSERNNSATAPGVVWRGQTSVVSRLIKGWDIERLTQLASGAGKLGNVTALQPELNGLDYFIPWVALNLQDAIDFAALAIRTTIDVQRLTHGYQGAPFQGPIPGVGGPIEIAAVTTAGCAWVQETTLQGERPSGQAVRL